MTRPVLFGETTRSCTEIWLPALFPLADSIKLAVVIQFSDSIDLADLIQLPESLKSADSIELVELIQVVDSIQLADWLKLVESLTWIDSIQFADLIDARIAEIGRLDSLAKWPK